jgi:hypothetical protein
MILQVKVKVKLETLEEFAQKLVAGELDRSAIISETYCEKENPSIGISYWSVDDIDEFETKFASWKEYYEEAEIKRVITAKEAVMKLFAKK